MSKLLSVLLVESDEFVVKDVTASLRLANIPVMVAHSLSEVEKILGEVRPGMLLIRAGVGADDEINQFVKRFVSRQDIEQIPIVLLMKNSERTRVETSVKYCRGTVGLPVEFPAFTYRIQELFAARTVVPKVDEAELPTSSGVPEGAPSSEPTEKSSKRSTKGSSAPRVESPGARATIRGVDDRMVVAYSIQLLVLEAIRKNPAFESANVEEVPKLVAEITNRICLSYRPA